MKPDTSLNRYRYENTTTLTTGTGILKHKIKWYRYVPVPVKQIEYGSLRYGLMTLPYSIDKRITNKFITRPTGITCTVPVPACQQIRTLPADR